MSDHKAVRIVITGRVQGVMYRAWTEREATALGLSGWVRNRRDGSVEVLLSGAEKAVDGMVEACRSGPPLARVDHVAVFSAEPPLDTGFSQVASV